MTGDVSKLKVVDLKKELQKRALPTTGLKADMVERLQEAMAASEQGNDDAAAEDAASAGDPVVEETMQEVPSAENGQGVQSMEPVLDRIPLESAGETAAPDSAVVTSPESGMPASRGQVEDAKGGTEASLPLGPENGEAKDEEPQPGAEIDIGETNEPQVGSESPVIAAPQEAHSSSLAQRLEEQRNSPVKSAEPVSLQNEEGDGGMSPHEDPPAKLNVAATKNARTLGVTDLGDLGSQMLPSKSIYITGLIRPLTTGSLREKAEEFGDLDERLVVDGRALWLDGVKSHAYITYDDVQTSQRAREALTGTVFPPETGKEVQVFFVPTDVAGRCIDIEEKAWKDSRSRMELRVRPSEGGGGLLYSVHRLASESAGNPPQRTPKAADKHHTQGRERGQERERGPRGGRGRGPRGPPGPYGYGAHYDDSARRHDFERQSADSRREFRRQPPMDAPARRSYPDTKEYVSGRDESVRKPRAGDSHAEARLRLVEERIMAQRREREREGAGGGRDDRRGWNGAPSSRSNRGRGTYRQRGPPPHFDRRDGGGSSSGGDPYARPRDDWAGRDRY